mmetsp:Transcript_11618/g.14003  ORF Transcript_11618/g.14003 Transcript_11618/m.14003 type:complete len:92 (+) Transcript_11618:192-467(+)
MTSSFTCTTSIDVAVSKKTTTGTNGGGGRRRRQNLFDLAGNNHSIRRKRGETKPIINSASFTAAVTSSEVPANASESNLVYEDDNEDGIAV